MPILDVRLMLGLLLLTVGLAPLNAQPASAEFDGNRVDRALSALIEDGSLVGVSAVVHMRGEEVYYGNFGFADREAERPWQRDTLATLYSMTKPVTGVTLMSLYEDGLFDLDDPLSQYLPEFAGVQVLDGVREDGTPILVEPVRPIKVIDVFRHTACFGYEWDSAPAAAFMAKADLFNASKPLSQFSTELASLPLFCQPGKAWKYGVSVDVQARLAEVVTGRPYEELVTERVLEPLGMTETSYFVSSERKLRLAAGYMREDDGTIVRQSDDRVYGFRETKPIQINGGHGLISTIDDYLRFALMLQNEGKLGDVQILKPETVALMARDHLPEGVTDRDFLMTKGQMGFGLNFAVRTGPPNSDAEPFGVKGEFFWDGAASLLFWVDPANDITAVFFTQMMPFDLNAQAKFRRAVYDAAGLIEKPR
ncbi:serine hydrolase domain-containing protein [Erythrobacter sp. F6033]|uniref:serine hydrolase domain-containing protein n=1 Tax=Erythrobacter sp. F6033 TaxID=2926401 RepID=UPI001FF41A76|nr:serine hydrolase domain-containing protein [Erythrobacter sp. F6033]MCK0127095.1 beta-lactamase family protein [Erythrobacter sp. F6033]